MTINSRFKSVDYERLPVNSGADSFFEVQWKFRLGEKTGFVSEPDVIEKTSKMLASIFRVIVEEMKEEWMISDPIYAVDASFKMAYLKTCMRKKKFYQEINHGEEKE